MTNQWNEGYFTDDVYTYGYYRELSPVWQRFALLLNGIAPVQSEHPAYCELGFGQGMSLNIHAASVHGQWVGTDFNPQQVSFAQNMAQAAGSDVRILDNSFEQILERDDLPQFDAIGLHGIWSWISAENRQQIVQFVEKHLKVGGMFFISYNCNPGWAAAAPLRQLFHIHDTRGVHGQDTASRVQSALSFTEKLLAAKPKYAVSAGAIGERFSHIKDQNARYLAHEYFNLHWDLMYFTDVVDILEGAKLEYAGSGNVFNAVQGLGMSAEAQAFLATVPDRIMREQVADYFTNCQFRKDIFIRGGRHLKPFEKHTMLNQEHFVLLRHPEDIVFKVSAGMGECMLKEEIYKPVIEYLSTDNFSPKTLGDLERGLSPGLSYAEIASAMLVLAGADYAAPCQSAEMTQKVKKNTDALNAYICNQARYATHEVVSLASPVLGGGVVVGALEQLLVHALKSTKKMDPADFLWNTLKARGERFSTEGHPIENDEENRAHAQKIYAEFTIKKLPILKALGVL